MNNFHALGLFTDDLNSDNFVVTSPFMIRHRLLSVERGGQAIKYILTMITHPLHCHTVFDLCA